MVRNVEACTAWPVCLERERQQAALLGCSARWRKKMQTRPFTSVIVRHLAPIFCHNAHFRSIRVASRRNLLETVFYTTKSVIVCRKRLCLSLGGEGGSIMKRWAHAYIFLLDLRLQIELIESMEVYEYECTVVCVNSLESEALFCTHLRQKKTQSYQTVRSSWEQIGNFQSAILPFFHSLSRSCAASCY